MNSFLPKTNQVKIGTYLTLSLSVAFLISFDDPVLQDKNLSSREYILLEERLMDFQDLTTPRVEIQVSGTDTVDTAYVTPPEAFPFQKGSWTFFYIPKGDTFISGGKLMLEVPFAFAPNIKSWTYPQVNDSNQRGFVKVRSSNPATNILLAKRSRLPFNYNITATFTGAPPTTGDTITFTYGDTSESPRGLATSNVHATSYEFRILADKRGTNSWNIIMPIPSIRVIPNPAKHFQITVPSFLTVEDSVSAVFVALDEYNNIDTEYTGILNVSCFGGSDCGTQNTVEFDSTDSGRIVVYFESGEGNHQLLAKDFFNTEHFSNPYIVSTAPHEYNLYWGDIQNHTNISDGNGTIEDFYNYAKNVANLDFIALTDHDHTYGVNYLTPEVWEKIREFAKVHNSDGKFVSFLGWEWTNESRGHKHIIYPGDDGEPYNYRSFPLPSDLWSALEGERALTISHHIAWGGRKVDWSFRNDNFQRVVEIYSQHGANEFLLNPLDHRIATGRAPGHYVRDALAMGHKLGIIASSDGHFGYPGNGWMWAPTALDSSSRATGFTGIYADTLTRESLFEALVDRRVFGTTDHRTIVEFKVNGKWMGSEIQSDSIPLISGTVLSHTPIKNVEIVKFNGKNYEITALDLDGAGLSFDFSYRDSLYVRSSFYYLRVTSVGNANDRFAWSSPVWVNKPFLQLTEQIPALDEYGYIIDGDTTHPTEAGFSFRTTSTPFSESIKLQFEVFDISDPLEAALYVNGIHLLSLPVSPPGEWSSAIVVEIPRYLVDTTNVLRFESQSNLNSSELDQWGVRNILLRSPVIKVTPSDSLHFGEVVNTDADTLKFNVMNTGQASLVVTAIMDFDSSLGVDPSSFIVAPNESFDVDIWLKTSVTDSLDVILEIYSNDPVTQVYQLVVDANIIIGVKDRNKQIPVRYELSQNYPNPFNPKTTLSYAIPRSGDVTLIIYNILGEEIISLVNEYQSAGSYEITWEASTQSSGIYFYRLRSGDYQQTKKMVLLK